MRAPTVQPPAAPASAGGDAATTGVGLPLVPYVGLVRAVPEPQEGPATGPTGPCQSPSKLNRTSSTQ